MDYLDFVTTPTGIHLTGYPDAVKVLKLTGPKARQLAALALHRSDLELALNILESINSFPPDMRAVRQGLWVSAIVQYFKCFGHSKARIKLEPNKIFKGDPQGVEVHYFNKAIRDKHITHDENAMMQSLPGAILNAPHLIRKIERVVCLSAEAETLDQQSNNNLHNLISKSLAYVIDKIDSLSDQIAEELEGQPYECLLEMDEVTLLLPSADKFHKPRTQ